MSCKDCSIETDVSELELFDGRCLSCHTDKLAEEIAIDEIIQMWKKQGHSDLEICWMLTTWN